MRRIWLSLRVAPMLTLGLTAVLGILLRDFFGPLPAWLVFWLGVVLVALAMLRGQSRYVLLVVWLGFYQLHGWSLAEAREHPLRTMLRASPHQESQARLKGSLLPLNEGSESGMALLDFHQFILAEKMPKRMQGRVRVQLPPGFNLEMAGEYEVEGLLQFAPPPMNPAQFDFGSYTLRKGWVALMEASRVSLVEAHKFAPKFAFLKAAESCRTWIIRQLMLGLPAGDRHAAVILAMTLGISDAAGEEVEDAFRGSGTLHVFAISGLHVMMLAGIFLWLARALGYERGIILVVLLLFGYAFITGWRPSAARASVMATMLLLAPLWDRKSRLLNTLGTSALLLLLFDTQQVFMTGFQLSFGVLMGIAFLTPHLMDWLRPWYEMDPFLPPQVASRAQRLSVKTRTWILGLLTVSLAAWLGSLPFMLGHFRTMTPVALLANLLLVPSAGVCLALACASLLFGALQLAWLSALANQVNALMASFMVWSAGQFAALPGASFSVDLRFEKASAPVELRVFHLPKGGQAAHLRSGEGHWLLDTGNERAWRAVLLPWFRSQGVNRLDGMILSHTDMAHVGAVPAILDQFRVPRFYTSQLEPWRRESRHSSLRRLEHITEPDGPIWHRLALDATLLLGTKLPVSVRVLHPGHTDMLDRADDRGLVFMLEHGGLRVLCLNDAGRMTANQLLTRGFDLRCDVIVMSHNKMDLAALPLLLPAATPRVVIAGSMERFTGPSLRELLRQECAEHGVQLLETDLDGSVGIVFHEAGLALKSFYTERDFWLPAVHR